VGNGIRQITHKTSTSMDIKSLVKNDYFIALALGSISAAAFAPLYFFPFAFIAFSGLLVLTNRCQNKEHYLKQSFWIGWCFGFGQFVFGLYWISISLFVDIAKFFWLLPFALFLIPAVLAIYIGLVVTLVNFLARNLSTNKWQKILLLAIIWVLFEYFRSILFTGFPWNLLGYSLLFSLPLSQSAAIFGVYGLSLIAVIFYCSPTLFFTLRNHKIKFYSEPKYQPFLATLAVVIGLMWLGGFYRLHIFHPTIIPNATFRLVQPAIKQKEKWQQDYRYNAFLENVRLTHQVGFENVNYVVWSESAVPYVINPLTSYGLLADIASATPKDGFVITGALRAEFKDDSKTPDKIWNTIFAIDSAGKVAESYDKNHLVPFGEYIPFSDLFPFISKITDGALNFSEGDGLKTIKLNSKMPSFSPLVCYEAIFPGNVFDKTNPPKFLLNLTNDAWFGNSSGPYQHFDMVRMRAIENAMPTIRVANNGISGLIDPLGEVIAAIPLNEKGVADVMLMENLDQTIYMQYGNQIVVLMSAILLVFAVFRRLDKKK
jgi:apolipoprotein N-acyltransferase